MPASLIGPLLPAAACAETFGDAPESAMFTSESVVVLNAVAQRRREFGTVRCCARLAMRELGLRAVAVLPDTDGAPRWPVGVVGSMTHCSGYRAAAVARATDLRGVGLDAEPHAPLPDAVHELVVGSDEQEPLALLAQSHPEVCWDRLLFCVKEAVFKAWFPLTRQWLDFTDVSTTLDPDGTFTARLQDGSADFAGRWTVGRGLVVAATGVPAAAAMELAA